MSRSFRSRCLLRLPRSSGAPARIREVKPRMSDEDKLIERAAADDTAAFRELYDRHRADVARLVYRMLGGRGDLEDVIQEVFVQVHKSLKDFRGQSKFSTWLHRVTVNVVLMHRRAARSRPVFADEPLGEAARPRRRGASRRGRRAPRARPRVRAACSTAWPTRSASSSSCTSSRASRRARSPRSSARRC